MNLKDLYINDTLNILEGMDYFNIQIILNVIADFEKNSQYPIYPFYEIVNDSNGQKISIKKTPSLKDGFKVADVIISKLLSFLQREVSRIREEGFNMIDLEKEELQEQLLKRLDDTYSYLEKVPVYNNIYISFRKDYIKLLTKIFRRVESRVMFHKSELIESQLRCYSKPVKAGTAFQKVINNKPQRRKNF